jgi:hypothetical protein
MAMIGVGDVATRSPEVGPGGDQLPFIYRDVGPNPPPEFIPRPFNCPEGSDFDKSQEVGMCVGPDYDPIYSQATPGGVRTYYDLTGAAAGQYKPGAAAKSLLPGIPDTYIYVGAGAALLLALMRRRR